MRLLVTGNCEEVGGFLVCKFAPSSTRWPGKFSTLALYRAAPGTNSGIMHFIEEVIIVPNALKGKDKERHWSSWDFKRAQDLAEETASFYGQAHVLHFHSHPKGSQKPSVADIAFWASNCPWAQGIALGVIVTPFPLRLVCYEISYRTAGQPDKDRAVTGGSFFSWRNRALNALQKRGVRCFEHSPDGSKA